MKAILCPKYGTAEVLQLVQVNKPKPKDDEVLIKVYATSVTNSDIFIRSSILTSKLMQLPFRLMMGIKGPRNKIIGEVFAGKVEAFGSKIKRFKKGDNVYGLTGFSLGAYADYMCMKEKDSKQGCVALMPTNCTFEEATSAAYGGLLALQFMEKYELTNDSKVLIYGASGTTGTIAVQYAHYLGSDVTGVCSAKNVQFVKSLGSKAVLDYTLDESIDQLEKYDFILDAVGKGKKSFLKMKLKKSLKKSGKFVSIDDDALVLDSDRLSRISKLVSSGEIKPITDKIYPFSKIIEAHKYVETGHKRGNVAVTVNLDSNNI